MIERSLTRGAVIAYVCLLQLPLLRAGSSTSDADFKRDLLQLQSLKHNEKVAQKSVSSCLDDEACVFSWVCDRIGKPVRFCSGPFFYFTVCCKTKTSDEISSDVVKLLPEITAATTTTIITTEPTTTATSTTTTPLKVESISPVPQQIMVSVCGRAPLVARGGRIVGGSAAQFAEYPFQVMVIIKGQERCGGALLDHGWIVTAGHCVAPASVTAQDIVVRLGVWDRTRANDILPVEERRVTRFILHPLYNSQRSFSHDVSLLKLDFPIEYQPHIQPVCLPHPGEDFLGSLATVTGWGRLEFREDRPLLLQHVEIPLITNQKCESMFEAQRTPEKIIPQMMCAATEDGRKDACQGDSGGPLTVTRDGSYILAGIVSWGYGCALPGYPGVYTRISQFTGWLIDTMRKES